MSQWRREALERFPELRREIADAEGMYFVWMALWHGLFKPAFKKEPPDTETMARVYNYAYWSFKHRSKEVRMAVADGFYEKLRDDLRTRRDMPRWISQEDFNNLHSAWDYYLTEQNFADFQREFMKNRVRIDNQKKAERSRFASG